MTSYFESVSDPLPPLSVIMAQHAMVGSAHSQLGGGMDEFLAAIPPETLRELRQHIEAGDRKKALLMACNYVVKFYTYVPMDMCLSHGEFVYSLLKLAKQSKRK